MKKIIYIFSLMLTVLTAVSSYGQQGVSIGTTTPDPKAMLTLESTTKAFLPPRMTTDQRDAIAAPSEGLTIFNITKNCMEWWNGTVWFNACGNPDSVVSAINCSVANSGSQLVGVAVSGLTQTISVTATTAGAYSFSTTQNGVTYASSGNLTVGTQNIVVTATGTPTAVGTYTYTVSIGGQSCTFNNTATLPNCATPTGSVSSGGNIAPGSSTSFTFTGSNYTSVSWSAPGGSPSSGTGASTGAISYASAGTYTITFTATNTGVCNTTSATFTATVTVINPTLTVNYCGITQTQSPSGLMQNGTSYTGTLTVPYTAGNGGGYPSDVVTANGLTLTRAAGTLANGAGNITYNLSGTYTGTSNNTAVFTLNMITSSPQITYSKDALRNSLYNTSGSGGASVTSYDAASNDAWIQINGTEYSNLSSGGSYCSATSSDIAGSNLGAGNYNSSGAGTNQTHALYSYDGAWVPQGLPQANNILYALAWVNGASNSSGQGMPTLWYGSSYLGGYTNTNGPILSSNTGGAGSVSYFVRKRSSLNIGNRIYIAGYKTSATLSYDCYTSEPGQTDGLNARPFAGGNQPPNSYANGCQPQTQLKLTSTGGQW